MNFVVAFNPFQTVHPEQHLGRAAMPPSSSFAIAPESADDAWIDEVMRGLYRGLLERDPEPSALQYWRDTIRLTGDIAAVSDAIVHSEEYQKKSLEKTRRRQSRSAISTVAVPWLEQQPLMIVDVGAQKLDDEEHVYHPFLTAGLPCKVIGFDPLRAEGSKTELPNTATHISTYPTFIGDGKSHLFRINNPVATSSLYPFNAGLTTELVGLNELYTERSEEVMTQTLDQTLADVASVDFLKLDIQGFELVALQNASELLKRTRVVHCEVSFTEIYQGQALFSEVEQLMRRAGFYFLDFSTSCRYPYRCPSQSTSADRLGWSDAVFFRHIEPLDTARALLVQALTAVLLYGKHSLAEYLLGNFDQRSGTDLATKFRST